MSGGRPVPARALAGLAALLAGACASVPPAGDPRTLDADIAAARVAAHAAYASGSPAAYREAMDRLVTVLPNQPELRFRLAAAQARAGDSAAACASLAAVAASGVEIDADGDPRNAADFAAMGRHPCLLDWLSSNAASARPRVASTPVHRFAERDALPSGLARDPGREAFLISTVLGRRLVKLGDDGRESALSLAAPERDWNLLAVAVDRTHDRLWISARATPGYPGIAVEDHGRAVLAAYALSTGERRVSLPLAPVGDTPAGVAAIAVLADGRVLAADADQGRVWLVDAGQGDWQLLADGLGSPQALAVAPDGRSAHLADAALGLWSITLPGGRLRRVVAEPALALTGIRGLVRDGDALVAVQAGVRPPRIVRFTLSADGLRVVGQQVLEQGVALLGEPGAAWLDDDALLYLAHVGRDRLGALGRMPLVSEAMAPELRRLPLRGAADAATGPETKNAR